MPLEASAAGPYPEHAMTRDKSNYAERQSGELLPRRAREYLPPQVIPSRPDARTMENESIKLSPDLDPRNARTQLSMRAIRSERRVWGGLVAGVALGSVLGGALWLVEDALVPRVGAPAPSATGATGSLESQYRSLAAEPAVTSVGRHEPVVEIIDEGSIDDSAEGSDEGVETWQQGASAGEPAGARQVVERRSGGGTPAPRRPVKRAAPVAPSSTPPVAAEPPSENEVWVKPRTERKVWLK